MLPKRASIRCGAVALTQILGRECGRAQQAPEGECEPLDAERVCSVLRAGARYFVYATVRTVRHLNDFRLLRSEKNFAHASPSGFRAYIDI